MSNATRRDAAVEPLTLVKVPPTYNVSPSGDTASAATVLLMLGLKLVSSVPSGLISISRLWVVLAPANSKAPETKTFTPDNPSTPD